MSTDSIFNSNGGHDNGTPPHVTINDVKDIAGLLAYKERHPEKSADIDKVLKDTSFDALVARGEMIMEQKGTNGKLLCPAYMNVYGR